MNIKKKTIFTAAAAVFLLYLAVFYWPAVSAFLGTALGAVMPIIIGGAIAYILNIIMSFYERWFFPKSQSRIIAKIRRPICLFGALITLLGVIAGVLVLVVPQLISCIQLIIAKVPAAFDGAVAYINSTNILPEDVMASIQSIDWSAMLETGFGFLTAGIGGAMNIAVQVVTSIFSGVITVVLSVIFAIYILSSKDKIGNQSRRAAKQYLSPKWYRRLGKLRRVVDDSFHKYIVGQCLEAVILGVLCAVGMLILDLPYAPMISAFVAFTALIPVAGSYIGAILGSFVILMDSPIKALIFLVFLILLQQFEGNLIYPRVVGSSVGLPAIWVLAAVTVGGGIMGVLGMIIAVPLASAAYRLIRMDVIKREMESEEIENG